MKSVSGQHLCKVLERHGWTLQRIRGSHHIYTQPDNSTILTIPVHSNRDLKRGTLGQILKAAELNEDDL